MIKLSINVCDVTRETYPLIQNAGTRPGSNLDSERRLDNNGKQAL